MLLLLHLKWRVNTKQADLIDRADWREDEGYEKERQAYRGEAARGNGKQKWTGMGEGKGGQMSENIAINRSYRADICDWQDMLMEAEMRDFSGKED